MREAFKKPIQEGGCQIVTQPDFNVARVWFAITEVNKTKWYLNLHPATKATGEGMGGEAMEAEVVDSISGEQLGTDIQTKHASQSRLNVFSTLDDVKKVIDKWAEPAGTRMKELRARD